MSLEEKGKEHCHAHCCHQVGGTASWELVSWEQASQALLLKSYLVELAGSLCRRSCSQDGTLTQRRDLMRFQPTLSKRSLTP